MVEPGDGESVETNAEEDSDAQVEEEGSPRHEMQVPNKRVKKQKSKAKASSRAAFDKQSLTVEMNCHGGAHGVPKFTGKWAVRAQNYHSSLVAASSSTLTIVTTSAGFNPHATRTEKVSCIRELLTH